MPSAVSARILHRLVQVGGHERAGQHRHGDEHPVADQLELDPAGLDVQVVQHLGGPGPAGHVVHHRGEHDHLLGVRRGAQEEHRRPDPDRHVALGVVDRRVAEHPAELGVHQLVQVRAGRGAWTATRSGSAGPSASAVPSTGVGVGLQQLGQLVRSQEDRVLHAVHVAERPDRQLADPVRIVLVAARTRSWAPARSSVDRRAAASPVASMVASWSGLSWKSSPSTALLAASPRTTCGRGLLSRRKGAPSPGRPGADGQVGRLVDHRDDLAQPGLELRPCGGDALVDVEVVDVGHPHLPPLRT